MKTSDIAVTCYFQDDGAAAGEILLSSFGLYLRQSLKPGYVPPAPATSRNQPDKRRQESRWKP